MSEPGYYKKLLAAGYKPEQILICPWGDPCPCELNGPQTYCGLGHQRPADKTDDVPGATNPLIAYNTCRTMVSSAKSRR
jgi:hypothetical protein